jgi:xylulose-5-phosphate/fructose-6-phosphate phosphoketolase
MSLFPPEVHPHGISDSRFVEVFTEEKPVIFAFHGYQRAVHEIVHGRPRADRFHVRGFNEQGTTTTPFDMVVLNGMSRYQLAMAAILRVERFVDRAAPLIVRCQAEIDSAVEYARTHFEDRPDVRDWVWTEE